MVDGYTSSSILYDYLIKNYKSIYPKFTLEYHIPTGKEHGLEALMPDLTEKKKYDLIILPDAGSNDFEEHRVLKELGYDICCIDHHIVEHPSEHAIVVNNQASERYSNKMLSGVGVVYQLLRCFDKRNNWDSANYYLDIVALGLISDMMEMTTLENRFICDYGLSHINNGFFKEMIEKQAFSLGDGPLTQIGVAFYITPLINALIRVGTQTDKEKLFIAFLNPDKVVPSTKRGEKGKTEKISTQAARNCVNAKARQKREMDKAAELLKIQISNDCLDDNKILILSADELDIPRTLTGLCAMKIVSEYKKPVLLGRTNSNGEFKGSIRCDGNSELKDFKSFLLSSNLMDFVQGHSMAAGYSMPASNIDKLYDFANKELKDINFNEGCYEVDFILNGNCSYLKTLIKELSQGEKFWGQGCAEPVLAIENIPIKTSDIKIMGQYKDTIKFEFNGITYVKFKAKDIIDTLFLKNDKQIATIVGRGNLNIWGGKTIPQILIDDIEFKEVEDNGF